MKALRTLTCNAWFLRFVVWVNRLTTNPYSGIQHAALHGRARHTNWRNHALHIEAKATAISIIHAANPCLSYSFQTRLIMPNEFIDFSSFRWLRKRATALMVGLPASVCFNLQNSEKVVLHLVFHSYQHTHRLIEFALIGNIMWLPDHILYTLHSIVCCTDQLRRLLACIALHLDYTCAHWIWCPFKMHRSFSIKIVKLQAWHCVAWCALLYAIHGIVVYWATIEFKCPQGDKIYTIPNVKFMCLDAWNILYG